MFFSDRRHQTFIEQVGQNNPKTSFELIAATVISPISDSGGF